MSAYPVTEEPIKLRATLHCDHCARYLLNEKMLSPEDVKKAGFNIVIQVLNQVNAELQSTAHKRGWIVEQCHHPKVTCGVCRDKDELYP